MNCYNHTEAAAVAQCKDCNKGLCNTCAKRYTIPICTSCNADRIKSEKSKIAVEFLMTFGIGLVIAIIEVSSIKGTFSQHINVFLGSLLLWAAAFSGWQTLSSISPQYFLVLPVIGWILYIIFKLMLSLIIGSFVLPFRTIKNIRRYKELEKIVL